MQVEEYPASQAMAAASQALPARTAELAVQTIRVDRVQPVECEHVDLGRLLRPRRIEDQAGAIGDAAHRPAARRAGNYRQCRYCRHLLNLALTSLREALDITAASDASHSVVRCP
jgi:hypothetical protein